MQTPSSLGDRPKINSFNQSDDQSKNSITINCRRGPT